MLLSDKLFLGSILIAVLTQQLTAMDYYLDWLVCKTLEAEATAYLKKLS